MIVHFFDNLYTSVSDRNKFLKKIGFYSFNRLSIRFLANLVIPFYFKIAKQSFLRDPNSKGEKKIIVSLTSFPARISKVWIVIESILRQKHKPDKIILWLSKDQFSGLTDLPENLKRLIKRGLEIRFVDGDIKSHKKYFYILKEYPNDLLVTVDDDIIYSEIMLDKLFKYHRVYPESIICHRGSKYRFQNSEVAPYKDWDVLKTEFGPSFDIFQTSGGGTLYPPNSLHKEVLNMQVFLKYCLFADDIWLNFMSQMNKTSIVKTDYYSDLLPVIFCNREKLSKFNVSDNGNDKQLMNIRSFYIKDNFEDPLTRN